MWHYLISKAHLNKLVNIQYRCWPLQKLWFQEVIHQISAALRGLHFMILVSVLYLECAVVSLQFPAQTLQLAAGQDGLAVLVPQVVFLLDQLVLLLLQRSHLLLGVAVLFQLSQAHKYFSEVFLKDELSYIKVTLVADN